MRAAPFVPARDSRHRHAALALCRSLLRHGARIPLPKDLVPKAGQPNPVRALVLRQFRKNKGDTSPRLVLAALAGGYKFLSLFTQAQNQKSPSHAQVTTYIRGRFAENGGYITKESRPKPPPTPEPPQPPPLLVAKTGPDGLATYVRGRPPTPFEGLRDGRRHIPKLFVTSYNAAFLRMKKPQPPILSHTIRSTSARLQNRISKLQDLQAEGMEMARDEDEWESIVARLMDDEAGGEPPAGRARHRPPRDETYAGSLQLGIQELQADLRRQRLNGVARAQALVRIVEEEKRLAREEAPRRKVLAEARRKLEAQAEKA